MSPSRISRRVVADRLDWSARMVEEMRKLPLLDRELFFADNRNIWTVESCLRRALEALLDVGRHVLTKGFGVGVTEYKEVASSLHDKGVLGRPESDLLRLLAGYRNRLVHFYHEISPEELYQIASLQLDDLTRVAEAYRGWFAQNADKLDDTL